MQQGTFPGYRQIALRPFQFSGRTGALWQYTWQPPGRGRAEVLEALFQLATPSGQPGLPDPGDGTRRDLAAEAAGLQRGASHVPHGPLTGLGQ